MNHPEDHPGHTELDPEDDEDRIEEGVLAGSQVHQLVPSQQR